MTKQPTVYLSRRATFSASHRLYSPHLSHEENIALFDKCARENGHGHNYVLKVTVCGTVDPKTGVVIDLKEMERIIDEHVVNKVDHWHLNHDVEPFNEVIPTVENMAVVFWGWLQDALPQGLLYEVKLHETENNVAVYRGE